MPKENSGERYNTGSEESSERFSNRIIICKTSLQAGWLDRCEECIDPKYIGFPCFNCERRGLNTPALQGTYYCRVCREEEIEGESGEH